MTAESTVRITLALDDRDTEELQILLTEVASHENGAALDPRAVGFARRLFDEILSATDGIKYP